MEHMCRGTRDTCNVVPVTATFIPSTIMSVLLSCRGIQHGIKTVDAGIHAFPAMQVQDTFMNRTWCGVTWVFHR